MTLSLSCPFFVSQAFLEQTARTIEIDALDHRRFIRRRTSFTGLCIFLVTAGICARRSHSKEIRNIADLDRMQRVFIAKKIYPSFCNILLGSICFEIIGIHLIYQIELRWKITSHSHPLQFLMHQIVTRLHDIITMRDKKYDSWQSIIDITSVRYKIFTSSREFILLFLFLFLFLSRS